MSQWFSRNAALWWWTYSVLILGLGYGRMVQKLWSQTGGLGARYAPPLIATLLALVVLSTLYRRPWLRHVVWLIGFWSLCVSIVLLTLWLIWLALNDAASARILGWLWGLLAITIPGLSRWYVYVYRMPEIWRGRPVT